MWIQREAVNIIQKKENYRHSSKADLQVVLTNDNKLECNQIYVYKPDIIDAIITEIEKINK